MGKESKQAFSVTMFWMQVYLISDKLTLANITLWLIDFFLLQQYLLSTRTSDDYLLVPGGCDWLVTTAPKSYLFNPTRNCWDLKKKLPLSLFRFSI